MKMMFFVSNRRSAFAAATVGCSVGEVVRRISWAGCGVGGSDNSLIKLGTRVGAAAVGGSERCGDGDGVGSSEVGTDGACVGARVGSGRRREYFNVLVDGEPPMTYKYGSIIPEMCAYFGAGIGFPNAQHDVATVYTCTVVPYEGTGYPPVTKSLLLEAETE
jgi:hypothetical protein